MLDRTVYSNQEMHLMKYNSWQLLNFISNFRHVLNVVCFLLGYSPTSVV
jgi:hypothetical protein